MEEVVGIMSAHLESKTLVGLGILLAVIVGLALIGKLSSEAVEALKWIGGTFMGVRTAANIMENVVAAKSVDVAKKDDA